MILKGACYRIVCTTENEDRLDAIMLFTGCGIQYIPPHSPHLTPLLTSILYSPPTPFPLFPSQRIFPFSFSLATQTEEKVDFAKKFFGTWGWLISCLLSIICTCYKSTEGEICLSVSVQGKGGGEVSQEFHL